MASIEAVKKEQSLPEVPLKWADFMWSLEKLRHKPYGKKTSERDWFRINPLDMILLGCQTLSSNIPARRDHGTMMLVMECIGECMRSRPRYWARLLAVLLNTSQGEVPALILQRCVSSLVGFWKSLQNFPEFKSGLYSWAIHEVGIVRILEQLTLEKENALGPQAVAEVKSLLGEFQETVSSSRAAAEQFSEHSLVPVLLSALPGPNIPEPLSLQLYLTQQQSVGTEAPVNRDSLQRLTDALKEVSCDITSCLGHLISIIELLYVRREELPIEPAISGAERRGEFTSEAAEKQQLVPPSSNPVVVSTQERELETQASEKTKDDAELEEVREQVGEGGGSSTKRSDSVNEYKHPPSPNDLLAVLTTALTTWKTKAPTATQAPQGDASLGSDVASKLLSLAHVVLSSGPLHLTLPVATTFFSKPISTLMVYSTEGYLSNSPSKFLFELLEYVSSLVEQGVQPSRVIQTNLPNLFGPVFGTRSHTVSCKLLEYGYLAACSQHQKALLSEGLKFLVNVFHLFPPIDKVRAQTIAEMKRLKAVEAVQAIVDDLLNSVLVEAEEHEDGVSDREHASTAITAQEMEGNENGEDGNSEQAESPVVAEEREDGLEAVSEAERETDKDARLQILLRLLQLACSMIRNGDNTSFLFASVLPKLFTSSAPSTVNFNNTKLSKFFGEEPPPPLTCNPWHVDKKRFAIQLLDLATLSLENDMASPFHICGVVIPKLVGNLGRMQFSDEEKMTLTIDIINITHETLENGHNIDELISHGIDLLTILLPQSASGEELRHFISQMARQFVTSSHTSLLFLLKKSCQFMVDHFPDETVAIQELFKTLVFRGKRDEIRSVFRLCQEELKADKYSPVRHSLYSYTTGKLNHRQFIALCEIMVTLMDVEKPRRVAREVTTVAHVEEEGEEGEEERRKRKEEESALVVGRLTIPCLERLTNALTEKKFKKQEWEEIAAQLSRVALFRTLFHSEFSSFANLSSSELLHIFQSKFPPDVLCDEPTMQLLALCGSRIEHMQTPRYDSLKTLLSRTLQHFLTLDIAQSPASSNNLDTPNTGSDKPLQHTPTQPDSACGGMLASRPLQHTPTQPDSARGGMLASKPLQHTPTQPDSARGGMLASRMRELENHLVLSLPRNASDREKLIENGYSAKLWEEKLSVVVKTDGSHSLEENMRQTLLACYTEFTDILKQMAITYVSVDGEMVKSNELFSEELSMTELKGRRAVAVRVIDERLGRAKEGHFYEKKISLLAKEDEIEADFEKQAKAPVKPKTFTVALNTKFFDCARCCGAQIIGCYAPTGEHCERSLEIGVRYDSGIASIYDETGVEIENVEILFTPEGAYMFKAYSNGHPFDTSQVWVGLLVALLAEPSCLVPAVIIPKSYPNQRTWDTIRRGISTEITGGILTCQHDFSPEWRTYYDHRPEKVRMGVDVVLHPGFSLASPAAEPFRPTLGRQRSRMTKDLAGMMFDHVMQDLLQNEWWKHFRFLGKCISQCLSVCVQEGELRTSIIEEGLDYERWRNNFLRLKNPPGIPLSASAGIPLEPGCLPSRQQLVSALVQIIGTSLQDWSDYTLHDISEFCTQNHRQFIELKEFVEKARGSLEYLRHRLPSVRGCLKRCTFIVPLLSLPDSLQEEIIHWVFRNEDRVWRYRGGRDGHETLQQFMSFLGRDRDEKLEGGEMREEEGGGERRDKGKVYAGVVAFCVPSALALESAGLENVAQHFQVKNMVGYAVGELAKPLELSEDEVEDSLTGELELTRWHPQHGQDDCYEVVTAWVHPSYRGMNLGVQMYIDIAMQVPTRLVMCDMLEGSVERIVRSNWLLRLLERLRVLPMILQRRQQSYTVVTQTGVSELFEQVVFSVWPVRAAVTLHRAALQVRGHKAAIVAVLPALAMASVIVLRR